MTIESVHTIHEVNLSKDLDTGVKYLNQYRLIEKIGNGHNGKVYLALKENKFYAIKELSKISKISIINRDPSAKINSIRNEVDIMRLIQDHSYHPNIIKIFAFLDDPQLNKVFLIFEYCDGKHLKFGATVPYDIKTIHHILTNVLLGLEYLHWLGIIHRDIKPSNILQNDNFKEIKITDFGSSCSKFNWKDTTGTPAFMAPELFDSHHHGIDGTEVDIWALGITLYALFYRKLPFSGHNEFNLFNIVVYQEPDYSIELNTKEEESLIQLIKLMLIKNPKKRIKINEIKCHPFIKKNYSIFEYKQFIKFNENYLFNKKKNSKNLTISQKFKKLFEKKG